MKKSILFFLTLIFAGTVFASQPVIPMPAEYTAGDGNFNVPTDWKVNSELPVQTTEKLMKVLDHPFELTDKNFNLCLKEDKQLGDESYFCDVTPEGVTIKASSEKGFYYGLQTLYQLSKLQGNEIPVCTINDYPRFAHRGLMLDPVRYFIPKEEVLKMIDVASALKLNTLHIHLTDDNGWRIQIDKYPKLTEVGAWRVDRPEVFPGRKNAVSADEPTPIGGFYTKDDIREIVAYAADRHVDVIPEIEMPAHAAAAIASYPELACPVVDKFVGVFPGIGGPDASIIMCGGNEKVYDFYCDVLDEVIELFPYKYIHLGGDEADKSIWKQCELCNQKIADLNLDGYEGLQGYFMDRLNKYVISKGKTPMGWDEVTYGNPKEEMVILGWQGTGNVAVRDAKKTGRKFIMTPSKILYLLRYQGPQWFEPFTYFGNNTLNDVYNYEAVQEDWTPELKEQLLGIQGSLWTEFCESPEDVEYLLFPRLLAVSDIAWRPEGARDWTAFLEAVDNYIPELDRRDINHSRSMYNIQHKVTPNGNGVTLNLECERPDVEIIYTDQDGQKFNYGAPIELKGPATITATTYKDNFPMGQTLTLNIGFNKATGGKVSSDNCNNELQNVLTNGVRGSNRQSDFEWAGWHDRNAEFVVDLGEVKEFDNCTLGTLGFSHVCVAMPESVELYTSEDGNEYALAATVVTPEDLVFAKEPTKHDIDFNNLGAKARYLKVKAKNPGTIPASYAREGAKTWVYFDEIMVD